MIYAIGLGFWVVFGILAAISPILSIGWFLVVAAALGARVLFTHLARKRSGR